MKKVKKVPNAVRYNWPIVGKLGELMVLPISKLNVDVAMFKNMGATGYQRGEVSKANTLRMAQEFDWVVFGALVVMRRKDGSYWIVDGHQRWLAAIERGDIDKVPCLVSPSRGPADEALRCWKINRQQKQMGGIGNYLAGVAGGVSPYIDIDQWLHENGLRMVPNTINGDRRGTVDFATVIVDRWKIDVEATKRALLAAVELVRPTWEEAKDPDEQLEPERVHSTVFQGFFWLCRRGYDVHSRLGVLASKGGNSVIAAKCNILKGNPTAGAGEKKAAFAILQMLEKKPERMQWFLEDQLKQLRKARKWKRTPIPSDIPIDEQLELLRVQARNRPFKGKKYREEMTGSDKPIPAVWQLESLGRAVGVPCPDNPYDKQAQSHFLDELLEMVEPDIREEVGGYRRILGDVHALARLVNKNESGVFDGRGGSGMLS